MYMPFPHLVEVLDELVGVGRIHSHTGVAWDCWVDRNFVSRLENRSWVEVKDRGDGRLVLGCNIPCVWSLEEPSIFYQVV